MSNLIASNHITLIVGLGLTGVSVARYLTKAGKAFCVVDGNPKAETLESFKQAFPGINITVGDFRFEDWIGVSEIVLSPGVPRSHPAIVEAIENGIPVVGDVELFRRVVQAPIIAITGSNGKTTVTTIVGEMAIESGMNVKVGGNIGTPCLDLLCPEADLYVLELSSFQLESVGHLAADVACVLNLSPDHMDRYESYQDYHRAKQRIYFSAKTIVSNKDDALTQPPLSVSTKQILFGSGEPDLKDFGLRRNEGELFLAHGLKNLVAVSELKVRGLHNYLNALSALAIGYSAGLSVSAMIEALKNFKGLEHRCQFVSNVNGVDYYNDSKATNIGATIAALKGMRENIVLIAGGDAKGIDFSAFGSELPPNVKAVITIGVDGPQIFDSCKAYVTALSAGSLVDAVENARQIAELGDIVLLSPACASMDMFKNYQDRGQQFMQAVGALCSH